MKQANIILCRHTQTDLNAQHKYTGQIDVPLNSTGEAQAENLAIQLAKLSVSMIVSSDLIRTTQTAAKILKLHSSVALYTDCRLREVNLGKINGMSKNEARQLFPDAKFSTRNPNFDFRDVGGESYQQVIQRLTGCFDEIVENIKVTTATQSCIVIVGHGTALRLFLEHLGIPCLLEQGNYQKIIYTK